MTIVKPKRGENIQLSHMDTDSFVYDIKIDDFYKVIVDDVNARFDTNSYSRSGENSSGSSSSHRSKQGHWPYEGQTGRKDHDRVRGTQIKSVVYMLTHTFLRCYFEKLYC